VPLRYGGVRRGVKEWRSEPMQWGRRRRRRRKFL
jgi:hypothetical protein